VKRVIREPESNALIRLFEGRPSVVATSRVAHVEVLRAVSIADPAPEAEFDARRILSSCLLLDVSQEILESAARLASRELRTLDAIHLATAQSLAVDGIVTYDRRLAEAARAARFEVLAPS
jgi:predicted nucleic acid-binding protein